MVVIVCVYARVNTKIFVIFSHPRVQFDTYITFTVTPVSDFATQLYLRRVGLAIVRIDYLDTFHGVELARASWQTDARW